MCMRVYSTHVYFRITLHFCTSCIFGHMTKALHFEEIWRHDPVASSRFCPVFVATLLTATPCSPSCLTDGTLAVRFSDICFCVWWGFSWWWRGFVGQIYRYLLLCMMRILVMVTGLSGSDFQIFGCDQTCGRRCPPPTRLLAGSLMFLFEERFRYLYIRAKRLGWSSHW